MNFISEKIAIDTIFKCKISISGIEEFIDASSEISESESECSLEDNFGM